MFLIAGLAALRVMEKWIPENDSFHHSSILNFPHYEKKSSSHDVSIEHLSAFFARHLPTIGAPCAPSLPVRLIYIVDVICVFYFTETYMHLC
jgi:hypothetical protein